MTATCSTPETPALASRQGAERLIQLDVLRGIAILLVIGRHFVVNANEAGFLWPVAGLWQRFGWSGVDLFFVLSGFLVGGLLCAEIRKRGRLDVGRFIIRRGLKIWPSYYAYLAFVTVAALWAYPRLGVLSADEYHAPLWPSLLHFQNYYRIVDHNGHAIPAMPRTQLWSLAVEEHFYLILPVLLLLLLTFKRRIHLLPAVAAAAIVGCTLARCLTHNLVPFPWGTHVYPTHMRVDGLFFGVLLAYWYHFHGGFQPWVARYRVMLLVTGVLLLAPVAGRKLEEDAWIPAIGFTMLYVGYGCLLLAALSLPTGWRNTVSGWKKPAAWGFRALGWVGLYSYPIYLWHMDLGRFPTLYLLDGGVFGALPPALRWLTATTLYISLAILSGWLLGRLVEAPVLLLRDRLFPRRAAALAGPAGEPVGNATRPEEGPVGAWATSSGA